VSGGVSGLLRGVAPGARLGLALALVLVLVPGACTVHRPSEDLACTTNADCTGPDFRTCQGGYCLPSSCPATCTSCDEANQICDMTCDVTHPCGIVSCPTGWTCQIACTSPSACSSVTCETGSRCTVACATADACGTVTCTDACACDVSCAQGTCVDSCPSHGNGANRVDCTIDGTPGAACSSTAQTGCDTCTF